MELKISIKYPIKKRASQEYTNNFHIEIILRHYTLLVCLVAVHLSFILCVKNIIYVSAQTYC